MGQLSHEVENGIFYATWRHHQESGSQDSRPFEIWMAEENCRAPWVVRVTDTCHCLSSSIFSKFGIFPENVGEKT